MKMLSGFDSAIGAMILATVIYPHRKGHDLRRGCGLLALTFWVIGIVFIAT